MHEIMAKVTGSPLLKIDRTEANAMAKAIGEVAKHYPVKIDPKTAAWANLVTVAGAVYGPRIMAGRMLAKQAAEARRKEAEEARARAASPEFAFAN